LHKKNAPLEAARFLDQIIDNNPMIT